MRARLIWKLLAVNAVVMTLVLVAVWSAIELHASDYFMTLMEKYDVDAAEVNEMFLWANRKSLIWVAVGASVVVASLCFWLTRRILAPLQEMTVATQRIADGDYACRIASRPRDELGDLAESFNDMARGLAHMERLRRSMVVDVAHELRTPLNNLRGYIEALQDGLVEPTSRVFGTLHSELLRLVRLTEDLLEAARAGDVGERRRAPVDVISLLRETLGLFRPRLERRTIDVREAIDAGAAPVLADDDQLKQVFTNLLQNCLQFAPEGSWIRVCARSGPQLVRVEFSNPGAGIAEDDMPWIFEPYYRADKSRSRDTGGAGVGLAIVRSLVEAHGGRVGASSDAEATHIWIELPRVTGGTPTPSRV